jgi:hypothetical protein
MSYTIRNHSPNSDTNYVTPYTITPQSSARRTSRTRRSNKSLTSVNHQIVKIKDLLQKLNIHVKPELLRESIGIELLKQNKQNNLHSQATQSLNSDESLNSYNKEDYELIGNISSSIGTNSIYTNRKRTRQSERIEQPTLTITWVEVNSKFNGIGLGNFLIIYSIYLCTLYYPEIEYVLLDDDSDRSTSVKGNIYTKLGFEPVNKVSLSIVSNKKINITGPEMILRISDLMDNKANIFLTKCITKLTELVKKSPHSHITFSNQSRKKIKSNKSKTRKYRSI